MPQDPRPHTHCGLGHFNAIGIEGFFQKGQFKPRTHDLIIPELLAWYGICGYSELDQMRHSHDALLGKFSPRRLDSEPLFVEPLKIQQVSSSFGEFPFVLFLTKPAPGAKRGKGSRWYHFNFYNI
ncbi:hypothetical protein AVEN_49807-1 [Araneus ventricosus]|uniref:Uncharacterized protein n=1 Tax=Araneus ventricosus TaxID=182803 RepID=A0A4Y2JKF1_ARAVE|nr:hypothetical protein AVEN_49807-1 [Araneus ventricosus]